MVFLNPMDWNTEIPRAHTRAIDAFQYSNLGDYTQPKISMIVIIWHDFHIMIVPTMLYF